MKNNLTGQKFNRLTAKEYKDGKWLCECECGNMTSLLTYKLVKGSTKSCGCLRSEKSRENQKLSLISITKYEPRITSSRRVWKSYGYQDKKCDINYDDFYSMCQQNCNYCGVGPSNEYNCFLLKKDASDYARENGSFKYNGLDRVDNSIHHTLLNCVPCCYICNRAKGTKTQIDFYSYIKTLVINSFTDFIISPKQLPDNRYVIQSAKNAHRCYNDMDLSLKDFHSLSQMNCFYCGIYQSNKVNGPLTDKKASKKAKEEGWFLYNGIDRIDSAIGHSKENCVPCCKACNYAKGKLSLKDFHEWIDRIKAYNI